MCASAPLPPVPDFTRGHMPPLCKDARDILDNPNTTTSEKAWALYYLHKAVIQKACSDAAFNQRVRDDDRDLHQGRSASEWHALHEIMRKDFARVVAENDRLRAELAHVRAIRDGLLRDLDAVKEEDDKTIKKAWAERDTLRKDLELGRAAEREACAKAVEGYRMPQGFSVVQFEVITAIASAIRSRGQPAKPPLITEDQKWAAVSQVTAPEAKAEQERKNQEMHKFYEHLLTHTQVQHGASYPHCNAESTATASPPVAKGPGKPETCDNELPGFLELAKGVAGQEWPHTMDAREWADRFIETIRRHPNVPTDRETMLVWFANAIMAGYDTAQMHNAKAEKEKVTPVWCEHVAISHHDKPIPLDQWEHITTGHPAFAFCTFCGKPRPTTP